jgi:hypothetical protein
MGEFRRRFGAQTFLGHDGATAASLYLQSLDEALRYTAEILGGTPTPFQKKVPTKGLKGQIIKIARDSQWKRLSMQI